MSNFFLVFILSGQWVAWISDQPQFDGGSWTVFGHSWMISSHVKLIEIECACMGLNEHNWE